MTDPLNHVRRAIEAAEGREESILRGAHNSIVELRADRQRDRSEESEETVTDYQISCTIRYRVKATDRLQAPTVTETVTADDAVAAIEELEATYGDDLRAVESIDGRGAD